MKQVFSVKRNPVKISGGELDWSGFVSESFVAWLKDGALVCAYVLMALGLLIGAVWEYQSEYPDVLDYAGYLLGSGVLLWCAGKSIAWIKGL